MPTHSPSISYPTSHPLYAADFSQSCCQHSYQSVPSFNLVSPLWPFNLSPDVPNLVAQPWHSDSSSPVSSGKAVTSWLHSQEIPGSFFCCLPVVLSVQFFGSLQVMEGFFPLSQNPSVRKQKSISWCSSQLWGSWRETPAQPRAPAAPVWKLSWSTCKQNRLSPRLPGWPWKMKLCSRSRSGW